MKGYSKGQAGIGNLESLVFVLIVLGMTIALGLMFLTSTSTALKTMIGAGNATDPAVLAIAATITAISGIPTWIPIIVLAVIFVVILGLLMYIRRQSSGGMQ